MTDTEKDLLAEHRKANPRSRAVGLLRLVKNTSATKQYGCVLCGASGPTFSARWRETKASSSWGTAHVAGHIEARKEDHHE